MSKEKIVDTVCRLVADKKLKARELCAELRKHKIAIEKHELNSILYTALSKRPGLAVHDGVWSYSDTQAKKTSAPPKKAEPVPPKPSSLPAPTPLVPVKLDFTPDEDQRRVIEKPASARVLVEAGPGTGKTAVACLRMARLIEDEDLNPTNILVVTFTRTAVSEIRARVAHYLSPEVAAQMRISTIDSSAWHFEMIALDGKKELTSYDDTIEHAVRHIRQRDASLIDLLRSFEHVVVDEAQDVTGLRSELIVELVRALSSTCGVTIFADPLQAIYGFTLEEDQITVENPVDLLRKQLPELERLQLRTPHRFARNLGDFLGEARVVVANEFRNGAEKQEQLVDGIKSAALSFVRDYIPMAAELAPKHGALLLCRSRREAVQASSFFLSQGVAHRLRIAGLPDCIQPWMGRVFWDYPECAIDEDRYKRRYIERCEPVLPHEPSAEASWKLLLRLARGKSGNVDVAKLRGVLSRSRPPVDACVLDGSPVGPILGTIHASKGREADEVYLLLPRVTTKGDADEESRVLYVAATRARSRLYAVDAMSAWGSSFEESGRTFKLEKKRPKDARASRVKLEVGLDGDVHEVMTASTRLNASPAAVQQVQQALWEGRASVQRLNAERTDHGMEFRLTFDGGPGIIGSLSRRVLDDAKRAAKMAGDGLPSWSMSHVFAVATRTFVLPVDSREHDHLHEPYATTGFFLVPVVRGYGSTYINYPGARK